MLNNTIQDVLRGVTTQGKRLLGARNRPASIATEAKVVRRLRDKGIEVDLTRD